MHYHSPPALKHCVFAEGIDIGRLCRSHIVFLMNNFEKPASWTYGPTSRQFVAGQKAPMVEMDVSTPNRNLDVFVAQGSTGQAPWSLERDICWELNTAARGK
jgi:hypothetical protein